MPSPSKTPSALAWAFGTALITFIFGSAGVVGPTNSTGGVEGAIAPDPVAKPGEAANPAPTAAEHDAAQPIRDFWNVAGSDHGKQFADELIAHAGAMELEFLIAALPDPIDSRFSYRFDSVIDDIQMAIESQDWLLDRFWFPWLPSGRQPARRDQIKEVTDPAHRARWCCSSRSRRAAPGPRRPWRSPRVRRRPPGRRRSCRSTSVFRA